MSRVEEDLKEREQIRYQWMLQVISRFKLFFAGLVFAILAFSVQFSVHSSNPWVKWLQVAAWVFLIIAGFFALRDAGGFRTTYTEKVSEGLSAKNRRRMWAFFLIAIVLLALSRSIS